MGEIMKREEINSRLVKGVGGLAGGIGLFVVNNVTHMWSLVGFHPLGLVVGAGLFFLGLNLLKKEKSKLAGFVCTAVGVLAAATALPFIGSLATFLLVGGGIALVVGGGFNLFKAIKGIQSRQS